MSGATRCDEVAAEAGLGERRRLYRTSRRIGDGVGKWGLGLPGILVFAASGWTWWGAVLAVAAVAAAAVAYQKVPPRSGLVAVARYQGGLVLHHAGGDFRALPWDAIESYEYIPSRMEFRGNLSVEHFGRVLILARGRETPFVVSKLAGRYEPGLAEAIRAGLLPRYTAPLHERFEEEGHVLFGTVLAVLPAGLLLDPDDDHPTAPLPWSDLQDISAEDTRELRITERTGPGRGGRVVTRVLTDADVVAAFVRETRAKLLAEQRPE
ncbi:hypothetical protein ACFVXH_13625 [Kitasatospora sp. NPDC058184]|uniref:hypothetical protein n=1 Tax=Kitasatospora sp. NPDC058184 TaxID=3346370 RepID=UPI0036D9B2F4